MLSKQWLTGAAGALGLAAMMGAAQSAPLGNTANDFRAAIAPASNLERAQYRLCVTEGGARQCRRVEIYGPGQFGMAPAPSVYGYQGPVSGVYGYQAPLAGIDSAYPPVGYGYQPAREYIGNYTDTYSNPDDYPAGSRPWWESMDKLGRGGQKD